MISLPFKKGEKKSAIERVQELGSHGRSEKEIINMMRQEGYSNEEISGALNKAIKFRVSGPSSGYTDQPPTPSYTRGGPSSRFVAPPPETSGSWEGSGDSNVIEMTEEEEIGLEELIEEIIEEKWKSVNSDLEEIQKGFIQLQDQIDFLNQRINKIEEKDKEKETQIKEMIQDSSNQMQRIEGRIGSVEKAFKDFLPNLTENVRSLSSIVEKMKKSTGETGSSKKSNKK